MDRIRKALLGVALLPFCGAVFAWFSPSQPELVASAAPRPALGFRTYAINKGDVPPAPFIHTSFDFVNQSDRPVRISTVTPSCGCLVTKLVENQREYDPGEYGMLQVSLPTANEVPGPHDYTIKIAYDDGQPREETLRLTMNLPEPIVRVEPSEIYFYQLTGDADSRDVVLVDPRDSPLKITDARLVLLIGQEACPAELATVTIEESKSTNGETRIPVRIHVAGSVPPTRTIAHLVISTSDPDFKTMKVPVLIQGPTRPIVPAAAEVPAESTERN